ncbi:MAG TPA: GNAT family N-acetyltransferase [Coleofasciculaceae cyanobacterium]|jgi:hypothetical protein
MNMMELHPVATVATPPHAEPYPYETESFFNCWWEHLAPKFDIPFKNHELLIYRKPVMKGLFKMKEVHIAGWNNAWSQDLTADRVNELEELDYTTAWDYFRINFMESRRGLQALDLLITKGYPMLMRPAPTQFVADLSEGMDSYLKSLSYNGRSNLKKKTQRAEFLNPELLPCTDETEIDAFFEEFFRHHLVYWDAKAGRSYFHDPEERNFIVNWAKVLHRSGNLRLDRLLMNGETANLNMSIVTGKALYWLLPINTGLYQEYWPGVVGLYLRLQQAEEAGITHFNMGPGDYLYKTQSANSRELCQELTVFNPRSPKGQALYYYMRRQQATPKSAEATTPNA